MRTLELFNLVAKIILNTDEYEKGVKNAAQESSTFFDTLKAHLTSEAIISGLKSLGSGIKSMAGDFIDAAASVKAETSQFEQTFGELQGAASEAIGNVAQNAGVLETRLTTLGSQIYAFARSSGGDTAESMELMESALQAAADGAAYYDRSLEDTTATLQSFLKGNFENDAALGLSATETTRNAAAMELFGQEFADLTEIQKQQTLLQMVLDAQELSGAMGQAAREADGWENVQGNLNEAWRQFMANAGAPLLESLVPIIQNITASLTEWTASIDWEAFSANITGFISAIVDNGPTIISLIAGIGAGFVAWNVVTMIQGVVAAIKAFKVANEGLKISQIAVNAVMNANPLAIVATLITGVVTALTVLWTTNEDFRDAVKRIWEDIKGFFVGAWENIKAAWDVVKGYFEAIWSAIQMIFAPVEDFLGNAFSQAWNAIKAVWDAVTGYFDTVWETIKGIFSVVGSVLSGDFQGAWDAIKGIVDQWGDYFSGVWEDITGVFSDAWDTFKAIGSDIVDGIKQGVSNAWDTFTKWVKDKFNALVAGVKKTLGIASPSRVFRDEIGQYIGLGVAAGIEKSEDEATRAAEELARSVYSASKEWADRQTKYQALSLEEQIELWETIQSQFVEGSEQWLDAEEEIFDRRQELMEEQLEEQERAMRELQEAEEASLRAREQAQEEYAAKVAAINDEIAAIQQHYQDALEARTQEIFNSFSLFEQIPEREEVSGETLISNLEGQLATMEDFYAGLDELAARGVGEDLIEEIRAMGPDAVAELDALLALSDERLTEYAELYAEKQRMANELAIDELANLRAETNEQVLEQMLELERLYAENGPNAGMALTEGIANGIEQGMPRIFSMVGSLAAAVGKALAPQSLILPVTPAISRGSVLPKSQAFTSAAYSGTNSGNIEAVLSALGQNLEKAIGQMNAGGNFTITIKPAPGIARYLKYELDAETTRQGAKLVRGTT